MQPEKKIKEYGKLFGERLARQKYLMQIWLHECQEVFNYSEKFQIKHHGYVYIEEFNKLLLKLNEIDKVVHLFRYNKLTIMKLKDFVNSLLLQFPYMYEDETEDFRVMIEVLDNLNEIYSEETMKLFLDEFIYYYQETLSRNLKECDEDEAGIMISEFINDNQLNEAGEKIFYELVDCLLYPIRTNVKNAYWSYGQLEFLFEAYNKNFKIIEEYSPLKIKNFLKKNPELLPFIEPIKEIVRGRENVPPGDDFSWWTCHYEYRNKMTNEVFRLSELQEKYNLGFNDVKIWTVIQNDYFSEEVYVMNSNHPKKCR